MTSVADPGADIPAALASAMFEVAPGSNRRGVLSEADWRFLVADDGRTDVLLIGIPRPAVLNALTHSGRRIVIATASRRGDGAVAELAERDGPGNVEIVRAGARDILPFPNDAFDLIVAPVSAVHAPRLNARVIAELARIVRPTGTVYIEGGTGSTALAAKAWRRVAGAGARVRRFWLVRHAREIRAAIPLEDVTALAPLLFDDVLYARSRLGRVLSPVVGWLARRGVLHYLLPARGLVLRRTPRSPHPFEQVVTVARRHGLDLSRHRSALLTPGSYDSNKVAVYFFDPAGRARDVIVKMTRSPEFNQRLEREYASLRCLGQLIGVAEGTYPEPLFLGAHGGLSMLAQRVVAGAPFRVRTAARPDCPIAGDAIDWLTRLAAVSVNRDAVSAQELSVRLAGLLDQTDALYTLSPAERQFLQSRIRAVQAWTGSVPMVFRHGDAGTWNILASAEGKSAFLDWEAAESVGPPLWDLFDFIRSFGTWIGRTRGESSATAIYEAAFLANGPLAALQRDAVRRYCAEIGVPRQLVEPLFYTCWMQRAQREAAWATRPLGEATYINLLRLCIRGRNQVGLRWLLD